VTSARAIATELVNAFDVLRDKGLLLFTAAPSQAFQRVSWYATTPFSYSEGHATVEQYREWVIGSHYSAVLPDASLLQITYDVLGGEIAGHRLAYVPCPVIVDKDLIREEPLIDVVDSYLADGYAAVALRSPLRFDFDPGAASERHPASHMTFNSADCRIACVAPMHPYQFLDLVFTSFYPTLRVAGQDWFDEGARRAYRQRVITEEERAGVHMLWPLD